MNYPICLYLYFKIMIMMLEKFQENEQQSC